MRRNIEDLWSGDLKMSRQIFFRIKSQKFVHSWDIEKDLATGGLAGQKPPLFTSNIVLFSPFTTGQVPPRRLLWTRYVHKKVRPGCGAKSGSKFDNYCSSQKRQKGTCLCMELIQIFAKWKSGLHWHSRSVINICAFGFGHFVFGYFGWWPDG